MSGWIDISVPLYNEMVHWPGDRPFELLREADMQLGAEYNLSSFRTSAHAGTHMDAPLHFIDGGMDMSQLPLEAVIGPARVVEIAGRISEDEVRRCGIRAGERILFKTTNSSRAWYDQPFQEGFVAIEADAARHIARLKPGLVGVDYLSVGAYQADGAETHRHLLGAGIWVVEGLNLHGVAPGNYELVCLPLKIVRAEGAPARAVLRAA